MGLFRFLLELCEPGRLGYGSWFGEDLKPVHNGKKKRRVRDLWVNLGVLVFAAVRDFQFCQLCQWMCSMSALVD